ncbi:MAG: hypothetical protein ACOX56_06530 [Acholeplasmataceae bacterium]|jgi:putative aldouronate transport system substrate-binding protein
MRKTIKKALLLMLSLVLVVGLFACNGNDKPPKPDPNGGNNGDNDNGGSDELVIPGLGGTYRYFLHNDGHNFNQTARVFKDAQDYAKIQTVQEVLQKSDTNYRTKFNLSLKDGLDFATFDQDTIESNGMNGTFIDLTELIDKYAPNIKAFFEANPQQKEWATAADGKIYGIPFYTAGETAKAFFVRKDYVDILRANNKMPAGFPTDLNKMTVVQFEELLIALKENASLITGGKTTSANFYPYFDRDTRYGIAELVSLWGAHGGFYKDDEGNVKYGPAEPEYKVAMENLARWAEKGLIGDNLFVEDNRDLRQVAFQQQIGAVTHDWIGSTYDFNSDFIKSSYQQPNLEIVGIHPPTRADGSKFEPTKRKEIGQVTAIHKNVDNDGRIRIIRWMDYFFTAAGNDGLNFGIENVTFNKIGGKYSFTNRIMNEENTPLENLYSYGAQMNQPGVQNFVYEQTWLSVEAYVLMEDYQDPDTGFIDQSYNDLIYPNIKLSKEEYNSANPIVDNLERKLADTHTQWIRNKSASAGISDADWQLFVNELKQLNYEQLITLYQGHVNKKK